MKPRTKAALERAAEHLATTGEAMTWVEGVGSPRTSLQWTRSSHPHTLTDEELHGIAMRLQRLTGPRGERIRRFVVGMLVEYEEMKNDA